MSKHTLKIPSKGKAYSKTSITLSELSNEDPSLLKLNSHFSRSRDQNSTAYSECAMVFNFVGSAVNTGTCLVFSVFFCLFVWVFLWKPYLCYSRRVRGCKLFLGRSGGISILKGQRSNKSTTSSTLAELSESELSSFQRICLRVQTDRKV